MTFGPPASPRQESGAGGPPDEDPRPGRLQSLARRLSEQELDGLLVTHPPNLRYLTGFTGSAGLLLVRPSGATLVVDGRYGEQAAGEAGDVAEVEVAEEGLHAGLARTMGGGSGRRIGFEAHRITVEERERLGDEVEGVEWRGTARLVEGLRQRKGPGEVALMAEAAARACRVLEDVLGVVEEGVTEEEVAAELDYRLRRAGSGPPPFPSIVASGPRSALPHARPSRRTLREGDVVLLDFGATEGGYASDLTRCVVLGPAAPWQREAQAAVRAARDAAVEALRPGRPAREVDEAARGILEQHGLADAFEHSTGHGLGLEVHEDPSLSRRSEATLQEGNVVTIEPGVYLRGRGGIRLEDDVALTAEGTRVLTSSPRELREL